MHDEPPATPPTCAECATPWLNETQCWRSYLDDEDTPRLFCADCAEREFDEDEART